MVKLPSELKCSSVSSIFCHKCVYKCYIHMYEYVYSYTFVNPIHLYIELPQWLSR